MREAERKLMCKEIASLGLIRLAQRREEEVTASVRLTGLAQWHMDASHC